MDTEYLSRLRKPSLPDHLSNLFNRKPSPLVHPPITLTSFSNVLLIDASVTDSQLFYDSVNADTFPILYSSSSLKSDLIAVLQRLSFQRLGIVFIQNTFVENQSFFSNTEFFNSFKHIDFLACNTLQDPRWVNFYATLTPVIGASNDKTGNLKYGGDWVMESTSEDIESVYFTENIEYYKYLLDTAYTTLIQGMTYPTGIAISGDSMFVTNSGNDTISKVTNLTGVLSIDYNWANGFSNPTGIAISGDSMFVTNIGNGQISKLTNLSGIPSIDHNWANGFSELRGIAIIGDTIYVTNGNSISKITDLSQNPPSITYDWANGFSGLRGITISGDSMFVTNYKRISKLTNLSQNPPSINYQWATGFTDPTDIAISGDSMFVINYINGQISKLTNLSQNPPSIDYQWATGFSNRPYGIAISGDSMFVTNFGNGQISKLTNLSQNPPSITYNCIFQLNSPLGMTISGDSMFVTNGGNGTISKVTNLTGVLSIKYDWATGFINPFSIAMSGNSMYVTNGNSISKLTNLSQNPPSIMYDWATGFTDPTDIAISGDSMYVTNNNGQISKLTNLSQNPPSIDYQWATDFSGPIGIVISGDSMFVTNYINDQISKLTNLSQNPPSITYDWATDFSGPVRMVINGDSMYVTNGGNGTISKITNLSTNPPSIDYGWATLPVAPSFCIVISGDYLYVAPLDNSLLRFDLPDEPDPPVSNICFPAGTPVLTDQGIVPIECIHPNLHTIQRQRIVDITKTVSTDSHLVEFKTHSLEYNYPRQTTRMSLKHKLYYHGKLCEAKTLLYLKQVSLVKYNGEILYNVLLDTHSTMNINGLICETLHPDNLIAKLYTNKCKLSVEKRDEVVRCLKECYEKKDYKGYETIALFC
jgi:hypothetical protein